MELKTERTRTTKDEEQRNLDEKEDVIDAYRYGTDYIPIDDPESLRLHAEKCFDILGFTNSSNVPRHYFMSDGVSQVQPQPDAEQNVREAFVAMVHAMFDADVYGIVRRVYSSRSDPGKNERLIKRELIALHLNANKRVLNELNFKSFNGWDSRVNTRLIIVNKG